jgi:serine/threonine-protein kinase
MKLVGRLDHPNVVRAYDADHAGPTLFIAMEYVSGSSLGQKFRSEGPLPPLDVARYASQAARGLAHAHDQAIVHRDIKPSNLLLGDTGLVKVLDLGLGVLTEADEEATFATADGIAVGTIDYMSPEQACGKEVDGRSDIYSLGCSMYHLISGRMPFSGASPVERLGKRINGRPAPIRDIRPDVPSRVALVLEQMLQPKITDRFASATAAAEALEAAVRPRSSAAPRKAATQPVPPPAPPPVADEAAVPSQAVLATPAPPEPRAVATRVRYPGWFRPLANLAETAPMAALAVLAAVVLLSFAAGVGAAVLLGR